MATYVNNLRLTELATGEGSGTWGATTNTNLELIGQALGFGTRAIANASTDNITIADGASDSDRAMYLKLTGGGQACTVTILPNTASKVWWMENATSYTLTFTCGSGANVAVLAGETKCISTDGLGSGGVVYDVLTDVNLAGTTKVDDLVVGDDLTVTDDMTVGGTLGVTGVLTATSLDISGDIDVDGTTNLDVVDIDGAVDMASTLTVAGVLTGASLDISGDIDVDGVTNLDVVDIDGAVDMASTLGVTGVLTANAGVVVDNLTIDANQIDVSSGNFVLDVAGEIELDADGGKWIFLDGGTQVGRIENSSSDFVIKSSVNDKDIKFNGEDGGSNITALTLDMSAAGDATFNNFVTAQRFYVPDAGLFIAGGGGDLKLSSDGTNGLIETVNGTLTLDVAGDIILNADGGDWKFQDGATGILEIQNDGTGNAVLITTTSDKDMRFLGNDGGSTITALTLDMSAAGAATFNAGITVGGNSIFNTPNINITADDARLLIEEADGTDIAYIGDITGAGVGGMFLYNHGGTATTQLRADSASTIGHGLNVLTAGANSSRINLTTGQPRTLTMESNGVGYTDNAALPAGQAQNSYIYTDVGGLSLGGGAVHLFTSTTNALSIDSSGNITKPLQPAFQARPASTQADIAINTAVTVVLGTEVFDVGANFASNTFTAPVTGKYQLNVELRLDNMDTAAGYYYLKLQTSNIIYHSIVDPGGLSSDPSYWSLTISALADMDASDTAYVAVYQAGGASQTDIDTDTAFSGYLAC